MSGVHLVTALDHAADPEVFRRAFPGVGTFVLEGGGSPALDRFVFMGAEPVAVVRARRRRAPDGAILRLPDGRADAEVTLDGRAYSGTALAALRELLVASAPQRVDPSYPFPLRAGLVGYVGYEYGQVQERLPCRPRSSLGLPDLTFGFHAWVLAARRDDPGRSWLSVVGPDPVEAERIRDHVLTALESPCEARVEARIAGGVLGAHEGLTPSEYRARVETARAHIFAGDAFEICLTDARDVPFDREDAWALHRELVARHAAPFAAFLELAEGAIVSSSPERFLAVDADGHAESRPIKGTRARGRTASEDASLVQSLATSEKDRAENAMIVDLVRNDLGRVCRFGSVVTPDLYAIETYATVHQLVSTVRGQLSPDKDALDLFAACFPPGSMTGAPKIEAMTILEELEPVERGVYSGALGWLDVGGAMDLSVVIRTAVVTAGIARISSGGAVVADSDPAAEHQEMLDKRRGLEAALACVERDAG